MSKQSERASQPSQYDAIIIGAGQAAMPLSAALAKAGWKTALIEREHLGGTCVNEGCTPTKTMVASARVAYLARRAAEYGVNTDDIRVDLKRVRERKRNIVDTYRSGSEQRVTETENLEWLSGEAQFIDAKTVEVKCNDGSVQYLTANYIFINAGARPVKPTIPGLEEVESSDSTSIMELAEVPEHLLVMGGGYIGLEFGQMFRRFGSRVTIIQQGAQLLGREDEDVASEIAKIMGEDGIDVLLNTKPLEVKQTAKRIHLEVQSSEGSKTIAGSHLLIATGRVPNTDRLNLEVAGIETDKRGFIKTNDKLETNVPGVYALGDIKGGPAFTHIAYDDYRIIRTNLLEKGDTSSNGRMVPYTVFIDPQLGRIGLSEGEAKEKGLNFRVAKIPMSYVARAVEMDEARGFMKALVDADSKQILGFVALGIEGGEIASLVQIAMMGNLPYTALRDGIFSHPGLAEGLNTLFSSLEI
jgi:pyruvate/2-oxoglutarate dehydrogenase complex dihydrolipoamide dehydrogenase (E3) component